MSCMIAFLQGGIPEIFPVPIELMRALETEGLRAMTEMIDLPHGAPAVQQYIGSALKPDRSPFHLTTLAPQLAPSLDARWRGAFFAPFGIGDILGTVEGDPGKAPFVTLAVKARLLVGGEEHAAVEWEVIGTQITTLNKAALIRNVNILNHGPHDSSDIRRCVALHAPQRVFGEPRAIVAMQCGVAAACLIEAIC
ncbi:MAG: hypothetical protein ACREFJ_13655 [Acetobacteraceae bacterium]